MNSLPLRADGPKRERGRVAESEPNEQSQAITRVVVASSFQTPTSRAARTPPTSLKGHRPTPSGPWKQLLILESTSLEKREDVVY